MGIKDLLNLFGIDIEPANEDHIFLSFRYEKEAFFVHVANVTAQ
jgi:hypothetical protein